MEKRPTMLTLKEVASFFSLSEKTVYRLVQTGILPAFKIGGQRRSDPRILDASVENGMAKAIVKRRAIGS